MNSLCVDFNLIGEGGLEGTVHGSTARGIASDYLVLCGLGTSIFMSNFFLSTDLLGVSHWGRGIQLCTGIEGLIVCSYIVCLLVYALSK